MPKFPIEVQWHYRAFDYAILEIEAPTLKEAQEIALARAEEHGLGDATAGQIYEAEYVINDE